ncbi:efflux RND transporter periplasmic adaptor subunit [Chitinivibrio alkaliphilus]|uniref:Efflux transporter, RND family, MFP subunit n=1 Tax=Chitinivibrio alkaliphilus ACht1 TaxID=1313304 RepID=U7DA67_9BACT|nr:efflux RND transporter periplasmic adaptor subunit [Chitinivibrio alkaliphilus]ERP38912.1 efflux transporter, RND family, MFP subunit [Chitinivibrio alkaliphilus ACht1]
MKRYLCVYMVIVLSMLGCSSQEGQEEFRSIQDIQDEQGIPVSVSEVERTSLKQVEEIGGTVKGHRQTYISTAAAGIVNRISVSPGDYVQNGQVVASMRFEQGSPIAVAQSAYDHAKRSYERVQRLQKEGAASSSELEAVRAQYENAKHSLGQARVAQYLRASFNGTVVDVLEKEGSKVDTRTPVVLMADMSRAKIELQASERTYERLQKGQRAFLFHGEDTLWGEVTDLSLSAHPLTHNFTVTTHFDNEEDNLRSGMYKQVRLVVHQKDDVITMPFDLIQYDLMGNPYAYVIENGRAKKRDLTLGVSDGMYYEVVSGLSEGDQLVVAGNSRLFSDAAVNVVNQ